MRPTTPVTLSPYRKYVCWYGMKRKEVNGPERFCGQFGEECEVSRPTEMIERMLGRIIVPAAKWGSAPSAKIRMYLCRMHREKLQEKGYIVTKVETI